MSNNNQNSQRVDADSNHIVIHHWKDPEGSSSGPIPSSGHFAIGYQEGVKHSIKGLYPSSKKDILGGQGEIKDDFEKVTDITKTPELAKKWNYHGEKIPLSKSEIANVAEVVAKREQLIQNSGKGYVVTKENCGDFGADIMKEAAPGKGTPGQYLSKEAYQKMDSLAAKYMESKYGYKGQNEFSKYSSSQERDIEKQFNLPERSVSSKGMEYQPSKYGDKVQFKYGINNPNVGASKYENTWGGWFNVPGYTTPLTPDPFASYKMSDFRYKAPYELYKSPLLKDLKETFRERKDEWNPTKNQVNKDPYSIELAKKDMANCLSHGGCGPIHLATLRSITGDYQSQPKAVLSSWVHLLRSKLGYAASHVSPLVFDLEGNGFDLLPYTKGVYFDIDNDGFKEKVGWLSAGDGQLARDINKNGSIDNITELFGDDLISAFLKLSLLDSNKDGVIDKNDDAFGELLMWQDKNLNGYSEPDELKTLKERGIKSISLSTTKVERVIEGNTITEISKFTYEDGREYEVADVHYHNDDMDSWYNTDLSVYEINKEELKEMLDFFRKDVFSKIRGAIKKSSNKGDLLEGDWLKKIIEQETNAVIGGYEKLKNGELDYLLEKINLQYSVNRKEYGIKCQKSIVDFASESDKAHRAKLKLVEEELLKEINSKLQSENENINLKYNKQIKETIDVKSQSLLDYYRSNGGTQADYDSAMESYIKQVQEDAIREEKQERLKSQEKYQEEYRQKAPNIRAKIEKDLEENFTENFLRKKSSCIDTKDGMRRMYGDQFSKVKKLTNKDVELIDIALKREANGIYIYHLNKIVESANKTEEDAKNKSYHNNISQWFKSPIKNLTNTEEYIKFSKDEYYEKTGSKLEDVAHKSEMTGLKIDLDTLTLPQMRGYGKIPSLDIAMTKNPKLKKMVTELTELTMTEFSEVSKKITDILYEWAEVANVKDGDRAVADGVNIEARKVAFIEQLTGQEFKQMGAAKFVGQHASTAVQRAWDLALMNITKNLLVQGPLKKLFPKAEYSFVTDEIKLNSSTDEIFEIAEKLAKESSGLGFWAMLGYKGDYNFWIHLGYILASCRSELNISLDLLNKKLSEKSGYDTKVGDDTFQIIGDDGDNLLKGTSGSDYIKGLKGNDKIYGEGGSDYIEGNDGDDELYGGDGIDRIYGGAGNDKIYGGNDRDFLYGEDGDDELYGEEGDDHIEGGAGADYMDGGSGINTLSYGSSPSGVNVNLTTKEVSGGHANGDRIKNFQNIGGSEHSDTLIGDDGDNHINGEGGNDRIYGGKGNDNLFGGPGEDYLYGEEGDDHFTGFEGPDYMDGGAGIDTVSYHHPYSTEGVIVNLKEGRGYLGYASGDTYEDIENVIGSKHRDKIYGDDEKNILNGMEGDDEIYGGKGDDIIIAASGDNKLYGEEGDDKIIIGTGSNYIDGGEGEDTLSYELSPSKIKVDMKKGKSSGSLIHESTFVNIENIFGSKFNDEIIGDDKDNKLYGLDGNDTIYGGAGNDHIEGGAGADEIDGGEGIDTIMFTRSPEGVTVNLEEGIGAGGDAEGDTYIDINGAIGSKFNDIIIGSEYFDILDGKEGDDEIHGMAGADYITGGAGNNKLYGEEGDDTFYLDEGNNEVDGGVGKDTINYQNYRKVEYEELVRFYNLAKKGRLLPERGGEKLPNIEFDRSGVKINLKEGYVEKGNGTKDKIINIENVTGSNFNDIITGDDGDNYIIGLNGNDIMHAGKGNDIIVAGFGENEVYGEEGDDLIIASPGKELIDGGEGNDSITYRHSNCGIKVNLKTGKCSGGYARGDHLVNIENIEGSEFDDVIYGSDADNIIITRDGNDKVYLNNGTDIVYTGNGDDSIFIIGSGNKFLSGGFGDDKFIFSNNFETTGNLGVVILDFDIYNNHELIDLSAFKSAKSFKELKISEVKKAVKDIDFPEILKSHFKRYDDVNISIIELGENQKISLLNIESRDLSNDNFIFWSEAGKESNNILQIDNLGAVHEEL